MENDFDYGEKKKALFLFYFTFGQAHNHLIDGIIYDKDCVVRILAQDVNSARDKMFELFGDKWAMMYLETPDMGFYPRGFFDIINQ